MGKRSKYAVSLVLLGSLFLAACQNGNQDNETDSSAASSAEQVINVQFSAEMGSADISLATDSYSFITLNNAYEGLYRLDENNVPVIAGASEDAEVSEDGLSYTISLRKRQNGPMAIQLLQLIMFLAGSEPLIQPLLPIMLICWHPLKTLPLFQMGR